MLQWNSFWHTDWLKYERDCLTSTFWLQKVIEGSQSGTQAEIDVGTMEECWFLFCSSQFVQDVSLYKQGSHSSLWHNSQWVGPSHINHISIKCTHRLAHKARLMDTIPQVTFLCPSVSSFCNVDKNYNDVDKNIVPDVEFIVINLIIKYSCTPKKIKYFEFGI